MKNNSHIITKVEAGSIADELGIEPGDELLLVNDKKIEDIFDYQYEINDEYITVVVKKPDNEEWEFEIEKDYNEDLGIEFAESLLDNYKSCRNKCIFCFIDQLPDGMRDTLYFKDDDSRLSFLQGNYITLTNMKIKDVERIIKYHLEPINISVHTTNPELRCRMLNNRFAGDIMDKLNLLNEGNITMNGQVVCCKGFNDGEELKRTIRDLSTLIPNMQSMSVVPFGMTDYREGLCKIEKFTPDDCAEVVKIIEDFQHEFLEKYGTVFVQASDEWYINAGLELPQAECYEGYCQIENGVGTVRSMSDEVDDYLNELMINSPLPRESYTRESTIATGVLAGPIMESFVEKIKKAYPKVNVTVYTLQNDFFGHNITVAGLLTGGDIYKNLKDKELGECLLLSETMLKSDEPIFLDDMRLDELEKALQIPIRIVKSDGKSFVDAVLGI